MKKDSGGEKVFIGNQPGKTLTGCAELIFIKHNYDREIKILP